MKQELHTTRPIVFLLVMLLAAAAPAAAQELILAVDVPTSLQGTDYLANQTVRFTPLGYALGFDGPAAGLGPDVNIDALVVLEDGSFLFSTDAPFEASSFTFDARDVVRYDAGGFSMHVDGGSLGLSPSANVDALARDLDGRLVLSLDAPEDLFGSQYMSSDLLVLEQGDLSLLLSGATMGLSAADDIAGLERDSAGWHVMFAEPTTAGTVTLLPGEVATWDGLTFWWLHGDASFPQESATNGLSFPGSPGKVDNLLLALDNGDVELTWATGCSSEASDYAVYEGALGDWGGSESKLCSTSGATAATVAADPGDRFFLIVPQNGRYEGSYGVDSSGGERPAAVGVGSACLSLQRLGECS